MAVTLTLPTAKGGPLTVAEMEANLTGLRDGKADDAKMVSASQLQNNSSLKSGLLQNAGDGLKNASGSGTPLSGWWHVINLAHKDGSGNSAQVALPCAGATPDAPFWRRATNGGWSEWRQLWDAASQPDEEGAWTPLLVGQTVAGAHTYQVQYGGYRRSGRSVDVWGGVILSARDPAMSGYACLSGLPFAPKAGDQIGAALNYFSNITLPAGKAQFTLGSNGDWGRVLLMACGGGAQAEILNHTHITNTAVVFFSLRYRV